MLLLNVLERDYAGLTEHLRYAQVAPLLFLWGEATAWRDDVPTPSLSHEEALENAPDKQDDGFAVPTFVET